MGALRDIVARGMNRVVAPFLPDRFRLGFNYQIKQLRHIEPELSRLDRLGPNRGAAIDAGANEGLYTHRLAGLYEHVHAFEINPNLAERLKRLAPANVSVHAVGLSSSTGTGTLRIPIFQGRLQNGWASLGQGHFPNADGYDEAPVALRSLDEFNLSGVTFMKVDVEGHELDLFKGAMETMRRNRPAVMVEINESNAPTIRALFADLGYVERPIADVIGGPDSGSNSYFAPK